MSQLTRCTHCQTVFRVTPEQLQAHGGQVRCGRCQQVFNARDALVPEVPAEPVAVTDPPAPAATAAAVAVFESPDPPAEPGLPAAPADDGLPPDPAPEMPAAAHVPEPESGPDPQAEEQVAPSAAAENPFIHESPAAREPAPRRRWLAAASLLLAITLAAQAGFFYRGDIAARHPLLRQWLDAACTQAGCEVPLPRTTKALLIEASDLQLADPAQPNRIQLTATLRNHAGHDVAYPALDLVLTNVNDHTLARRIFLPAEYLGNGRDLRAGIAANAELTVRLALETGNLGAAGFRLAVLPAPLRRAR